MTKLFAKIVALVLALTFCFSIVACTKPADNPANTDSATNSPEDSGTAEPGESVDEDTYAMDELPNLDYKGATVNLLYWSDVEMLEFVPKNDAEWDMSDIVQKSLYERNDAVERRLGVKLNFIGEVGNTSNTDVYLKRVQADFEGDRTYDISAAYSRTAGKCSTRGYFRNLSNNKYIDLSKPWYPESLIKNIKIGENLYYVSGDASVNTLYLMYTIYYNKDLLASREMEDPQELVKAKKWTIDKLIEMTTDTYINLDGDDNDYAGSLDLDDFYGFCTIDYGVDAFYTGSGYMLVDNKDKNGNLKISDDYTSEAVQNLTEKLQRWLTTKDCNVFPKKGDYRKPFVDGNALFCQERCYLAEKYLIGKNGDAGVSFKYGVVPTPLLDENQKDYITCLGNPFTLYSIMRACDDSEVDMLGAVIECWSSESHRRSTPALFEINIQLKYAKDSVDAQMFDICKRTITSDLGRVFSKDLNTMSEIWSDVAISNSSSWKTQCERQARALSTKLAAIVKEFQSLTK